MRKDRSNMIDIIRKIPEFYKKISRAERLEIMKLVELASRQVKPCDVILDAGSGKQQYKEYFSHAKYESADIIQLPGSEHDFICSLDNIPKPDNTYNAVLCTQVLEHVEFPQNVINEFYRVLKPEGMLFLSAPQGREVHGEPYHFFNFTEYGLASLFKQAGFEINFIKPNGGCFWDLAKRMKSLPRYMSKQYKNPENTDKISICNRLCWMLIVPWLFLLKPLYKYILPTLFFYLDTLDKKKLCTLGYSCYCTKSGISKSGG